MAARRSQEDGIILYITSREIKKRIEENNEAIKRAYPSAYVVRSIYKVAIDSVRIDAFDNKDQGACIEKLGCENKTLHLGLSIRSVE